MGVDVEQTAAATAKRRPDTRDRILEVAESLIALHGIEGFQLKDVADQVGIRPPSVFAHFKGRDAIAQAVAERLVSSIAEQLAAEDGEDPTVVLRRWSTNLVRHLYENPAHLRLILRDLAQAGSPEVQSYDSAMGLIQECQQRLATVLERGIELGEFRTVRVESVMTQFVGAAVANLAWDGFDDEGRPKPNAPVDQIQTEAAELLLGYLAAR